MSVLPKCFCMATICLCSAINSPITETTKMNVFVPGVRGGDGWREDEKENADYYLIKTLSLFCDP